MRTRPIPELTSLPLDQATHRKDNGDGRYKAEQDPNQFGQVIVPDWQGRMLDKGQPAIFSVLCQHHGKGKEGKARHGKSCHGQHIGLDKGLLHGVSSNWTVDEKIRKKMTGIPIDRRNTPKLLDNFTAST